MNSIMQDCLIQSKKDKAEISNRMNFISNMVEELEFGQK